MTMPCTPFTLPGGGRGFICTRGPRPRCACGQPATIQCDAPTKRKSGACDRREIRGLMRPRIGAGRGVEFPTERTDDMSDEQKPAAWIDNSGHPHHLRKVQVPTETRLCGPLRPLFEQAALDAAVAAERERCAKLCEDIGDGYQAREAYKWAELRSDAQTGAHDCADAIRQTGEKT